MMRNAFGAVFVLAASSSISLGACDQSAGVRRDPAANATAAARPPRPDDPLLEGETCTRSDDCPRAARCVDGRCTPTARSYQGEVLAERGVRALANGRFQDGAEAFRAALEAYQERQVPVPSSVSCGLARALMGVNDRGGAADARETMARALANCLTAAPPGSSMADQALAGLASLSERGLDPGSLDRPDASLMTGRDPRPTAENTHVRVQFVGTADGSRQLFRDAAQTDPVRQEIVRCFLQWWETSHQNADQGSVRVAYARAVDDYDELTAPHVTVTPVDMPAIPSGTDAGTNVHWLQCASAAVQSAVTTLRWPARQERWGESMVVSVGPN